MKFKKQKEINMGWLIGKHRAKSNTIQRLSEKFRKKKIKKKMK